MALSPSEAARPSSDTTGGGPRSTRPTSVRVSAAQLDVTRSSQF